MTSRLLPPEEWPRLAGTLLDGALSALDPSIDQVLVVEDGGAVVGCCALIRAWHLEGAWVAPAYRRRIGVGRRLLTGVRALLAKMGVREVLSMALVPEGRHLAEAIGQIVHLEGDHFAVQVGRPSDGCR